MYVTQKLTAHDLAAQERCPLPHHKPVSGHLPLWDWDGRCRSLWYTLYHARLSPAMEHYIQEHWRDGASHILVATSAWGMGIKVEKWSSGGLETWTPSTKDSADVLERKKSILGLEPRDYPDFINSPGTKCS